MSYLACRDRIETGDIILYSGKGPISTGIKAATFSHWSHVGMAVRVPRPDLVLVYQSTTLSKAMDLTSGEAVQGVQINLLSESIRIYNGDIGVRHLDVLRTPAMIQALTLFREEMKGKPYEENKLELIKSAWDGPFGHNEEDLSSLFCSELVAEAYQRMGLLSEEKPSNEYTPKDFAGDLPLLGGAMMGVTYLLKKG